VPQAVQKGIQGLPEPAATLGKILSKTAAEADSGRLVNNVDEILSEGWIDGLGNSFFNLLYTFAKNRVRMEASEENLGLLVFICRVVYE
jgi:hypothetical protein